MLLAFLSALTFTGPGKIFAIVQCESIIISNNYFIKVAPQSFYKSDSTNWQDLQKKP